MNFVFRRTDANDYSFYYECFENKEFSLMLFNNEIINLRKFISEEDNAIKLVAFYDKGKAQLLKFGFCHFYQKDINLFVYVGGISPIFFNSGLGLRSSIFILNQMFCIYPNAKFTTGVYQHNLRSYRMLKSIGFTEVMREDMKIHLILTKKNFYNDNTNELLKRIRGSLFY